jgi:hypothetical protein
MRTLLILIFALLLSARCMAQLDSLSVTNQKINEKIQVLKNDKIYTILCYYIYCSGRMPRLMLKDSCIAYDIKYLVWCDRGRFFMERFDECKSYQVQLFYQNPFYKPLNSYSKLRTEKILPREYRALIGNKMQLLVEDIDHACSAMFDFYLGNKFLHKEIDLSDLDRLVDDDKHNNINYAHNRSTIIESIREEMEQMAYLYNKKNGMK